MKKILEITLFLFVSLLIASCGGGGGETTFTVIAEPRLSLSDSSLDFGGVIVNNTSDRMFTITNNGNRSGLVINSFSSNVAQFSVPANTDNCSGKSLAINASCTFIVRFAPTAQDTYTSTISISSNDPKAISLQGKGYGLNVWLNKIISAACAAVVLDVTVTNPNGVLGVLTENDFFLTQGGATQTITGFILTDPDSVSAVLALDLSSSLTSALSDIRSAAQYFVDQLGTEDEAAIYKFKKDILSYPAASFITADVTGKTDLKNHIAPPDPVTDGTALFDALYDSITRAAAGNKSKKAVIALSDGANNITTGRTLAEVIDHAKFINIPIFTVYYVDPSRASDSKPAIMKQLAEETGGQDFYTDAATMQNIFDQISGLLSRKYMITYIPTSCTGSPLLEVEARSGALTGLDSKTVVFP